MVKNHQPPITDHAAVSDWLQRRGHLSLSWDELEKLELPNGIVTSMYKVGLPEDPASPTIFRVFYPPHCTVEAHTHACNYTEMVLEGSIRVGATWYQPGDIRVGMANRGYGPLTAGPEGCLLLFFFADGRWPAITIGKKNDGSTLNSGIIADHFENAGAESPGGI